MKWWIIIAGILSNTAANTVLKYAMLRPFSKTTPLIWEVLSNIYLLAGIFLYAIAFVFYALALKCIPLSVAYPVMTSGAMLLVAMISIFFFREPFTWKTTLGVLFIICGVLFVTQK
ncbi:MAG: EamA family transporter [Deltaproteobacteria bacterium]|jgi:multidrug transporter EmrE-like cation transporter|nr:EamA family transporter [Deltaproteobacteria bacterium]